MTHGLSQWKEGCKCFGASYSFLAYHEGKLFCVNLIMVGHKVCGDWMILYINVAPRKSTQEVFTRAQLSSLRNVPRF